ncbi:MAG: DUF5689 domain-containing protein [Bacteroidales bacterium]|nr:DUF5689 domain-containing protein [Bacteroidales bacterium]
MKKTFINIGLILASLVLVLSSCIHDEFDEPPIKEIPIGVVLTIQDLYSIFMSDSVASTSYKFVDDFSVYAVITMDDKSGNIYKAAYVQDGTRAINLHLMSSGGLYEGDSVRIYLKGLTLMDYRGMMQLDSVHVDNNIVKVSTLKHKTPELVTIDQINTGQYLAKLIKLEDMHFIEEDLGKTYANKEDLITENRTLEDELGQRVFVRTSGYASFAGNKIPTGKGSVIGILGKHDDDWQLLIRSTSEVKFRDAIITVNFDEIENGVPVDLEDWENYMEIGSLSWMGYVGTTNSSVRIIGDGQENSTWLILPQLEINKGVLEFRTRAGNLTGASLKAFISNDYDGEGNAENATWTELPANIATATSSSFGNWTHSGMIDLSEYNGQVRIAFKYVTETGQSGQYMLDDILIYSE